MFTPDENVWRKFIKGEFMKIKDVIIATSTYLGVKKIVDYFLDENALIDQTLQNKIDVMVRLTNLVISELATGYMPMITSQQVSGQSKIKISSLENRLLEVVSVKDANGNQIDYKISGEYIDCKKVAEVINYSFIPPTYDVNQEIECLDGKITAGILSFGVLAEYCIVEWRFEEAVMWRERFILAIKEIKKVKNGFIKERAWQ